MAIAFLATATAPPAICMAGEAPPPSAPRPLMDFSGSIADLIEGAARYDGQAVTLTGEIIGDIMVRGQKAWINISDQPTASIGVRASAAMVQNLQNAGSYRVRGDRVSVTGIFRRSSSSEGGELCMEAIDIRIITMGGPIARTISPGRIIRAGFSVFSALMIGIFWMKKVRAGHREGPDFHN